MIAPTGVPKHRSNVWKPWNLCDRWPINTIPLPPDFKEFLQALNHSKVEYLLVGGYAVAYHGYPRTTAAENANPTRPSRTVFFLRIFNPPHRFSKPRHRSD